MTCGNPHNEMTPEMVDMDSAFKSLSEEITAMNDYWQRIERCHDAELKKILMHARDEERQHASELIQWMTTKDPVFADHLRNMLVRGESLIEPAHHNHNPSNKY